MVQLTFHKKKSIKLVFFNDFGMFIYKKLKNIILIYFKLKYIFKKYFEVHH